MKRALLLALIVGVAGCQSTSTACAASEATMVPDPAEPAPSVRFGHADGSFQKDWRKSVKDTMGAATHAVVAVLGEGGPVVERTTEPFHEEGFWNVVATQDYSISPVADGFAASWVSDGLCGPMLGVEDSKEISSITTSWGPTQVVDMEGVFSDYHVNYLESEKPDYSGLKGGSKYLLLLNVWNVPESEKYPAETKYILLGFYELEGSMVVDETGTTDISTVAADIKSALKAQYDRYIGLKCCRAG